MSVVLLHLLLTLACQVDVGGDITRDRDGDGQNVLDGDCDDDDPGAFLGAEEVPYDGRDQDCDGEDLVDVDLDGHAGLPSGGTDCDDAQAGINPAATDTWYDGVDTNCDGADDFDQDLDTYVPDFYVGLPTTYVSTSGTLPGGDCDDLDAGRHPGLEDTWYDGFDADCGGGSDYDRDGDGFDADAYGGVDCDDLDGTVNPSAAEVLGDGTDNDCQNDAPVVDSLTLSPDEIYTDTLLFAVAELADADGDAVSPLYAWYIDGVLSDQTGEVLAPSSFSVGQTIYVRVTPEDGETAGAAVTSELVTVLNSTPQVHEVTIVPAPALVSDTLSVSVTASDPDEEPLAYAYRWLVDGAEVDDGPTLAAPYFVKGQEVVVQVEASDGAAVSGPAASPVLTISNSPPVLSSVEWSAHDVRTDDVLSVSASAFDADADAVSLSYRWLVDGVAVSAAGPTLDGADWFVKGQSVVVELTPEDGDDVGSAVLSAVVVIQNSLPSAPVLSIAPANPTAGYDDMVCLVDVPSEDADGDSLTYAVNWTVDTVTFTGATTTTLTGDTVRSSAYSSFQTWVCTVTAADSEGVSEPGSASVSVACDQDEDGFVAEACAGDDCDDQDALTNPDGVDVWYDGTDSDCNGWSEYDADGDGWDSSAYGGADCDDADSAVSPDANEVWYDGVDQDCAGDDDFDGDGDGERAYGFGDNDCDDTSAAAYSGAAEVCGDGLDNDCNGAAEITVPGDHATIQAGIDAAADDDTVCVGRGTWYENLDLGGKEFTLKGTDGSSLTIVDGGGAARVVTLDNGGGVESRIEGFTLTNGYHLTCGGGVYVEDETLVIKDVVITNSHSGQGGGGLCVWGGGYVDAVDFWVSNSTATYGGGGIRVWESELVLTSGGVDQCEAGYGGGIDVYSGTVTLTGVDITNCEADYGGGVQAYTTVLDFSDVEISGCTASEYQGGGMSLASSSVAMESVVVSGNQAESGGGIGLEYFDGTLSGVTVTGNSAGYGGGITVQGESPILSGLVISDNFAATGGGIYLSSSDALLTGVTLSGNQATDGGGGAWVSNSGEPLFENVLFDGNSSSFGYGGGLLSNEADVVVNNCVFSENESEGGGGLVGWGSSSPTDLAYVTVTNSVFVRNVARSSGGGAMSFTRGTMNPHLENLSLVGNEAQGGDGGGAICLRSRSVPTMVNVDMSENTSRAAGGAIWVEYGPAPTMQYCNAYDNSPDDYADMSDPTGSDGNISVNPQYSSTAGPDPLAWDLHLGTTSGLINVGDPTVFNPDGTTSNIGSLGGENAGDWDMDGDDWPLWWQPGAYDSSYTSAGWDCDDADVAVYPGVGC